MDYLVEKEEAVRAGEYALSALRAAQEKLRSARGWGIYDMLGGGLISSLIKRNRMDEAANALQSAQSALERFRKELGDLNLGWVAAELRGGDLLSFADWFFDGLLVDVMVQERINRARTEVDDAVFKVTKIMERLRNS